MTPDEIKAFQHAGSDHRGNPLDVDGVIGPVTRWALAVDRLGSGRRGCVRAACDAVGFIENPIGSNDDPEGWIRGLLARCKAPADLPWCAAFASWAIHHGPEIASAVRLGESLPKTMNPLPGDLMWFPTGAGKGHCGIVIGVSMTEVMTVEGNLDNRVQCVRRPRMFCNFSTSFTEKMPTEAIPGVIVFGVPLRSVNRVGTR